jgi:hypothetical protein
VSVTKPDSFEENAAKSFKACARYIVRAAANDVRTFLRNLNAGDVPGVTSAELRCLKAFRPGSEVLEEQTQLAIQSFLSGQSGLTRLYAMTHRGLAQQAIRQSIRAYSRSLGQPAIDFFRSKYEFLFLRLGLPVYVISRIDPNLNNDMPHAPVRQGRVRSTTNVASPTSVRVPARRGAAPTPP